MKPIKKAREQLWVIRVQKYRDQAAFTELYHAYIDKIYRFIYFKVDDTEIAKDLAADVFLKSWRHLIASDKEVRQIGPFLFVTARNLVIDYYRSGQKNRETALDLAIDIAADDQESKMVIMAEAQLVYALIKKLKQSYQEALLLRHIEDLSIKDIAEVIDKTPASTRVLLHRANQALKREYEKTASQTSTTAAQPETHSAE